MPKQKFPLFGRVVSLRDPDRPQDPHLYMAGRLFGATLTDGRKVKGQYVMRWWLNGDWYFRDCRPEELPVITDKE